MLKVQDSYNEKDLNNNKINNKAKSKISFTGHKVIQNDNGENIYRFYTPSLSLKQGEKVSLQIVQLRKDDNGNYQTVKNDVGKPDIRKYNFKSNQNYIDKHFEDLGLVEYDKSYANMAIGYKFKIGDKDYIDSTLLTTDRKWNIAIPPNRPILEEARPMYHILPDLMLSEKTKKNSPTILDERRTHSNKLGGNIDGIIEKIDYMKDLGIKRILSTPIFGQDNLSNHGYWTTNPYQITDSLGDISKFKELNTKLYKNGMGWIADGAFVNEGLEGIHTEHITKWGTQSPYIDWLTTFDFPDKSFKFGILSKKEDVNSKNLGIRLVNAPYKILKDEEGSESVEKNPYFDSKKPTYVQIYDKRLAGIKQINSNELIRDYDKKNSDDPNEINDYMDSFIPYKFRINPKEVSLKYKDWVSSKEIAARKEKETPPFRNFLTEWTNLAATNSDSDGGTVLWVGNKDISKLRFMMTEQDSREIKRKYGKMASEKIQKVEQSTNQVQDNIVQVGEFWTNEIAKTLHSYTAKELAGAETPADFMKKIQQKVKKGELPYAALKINEKQIDNLLDGSYNLKTAPSPQNVADGLMSYPLDAIEFNSGMSGILGSPFLKKLASKEEQIGISRYELYENQRYADYKDIPDDYRPVYKKMDKLIVGEMTEMAVNILKEVQHTGKLKTEIINKETGDLTEDGKEIYGLISNDIAKFIVTQGLLNEAKEHSPKLFDGTRKLYPDYENKELLVYDKEVLKDVSPESLDINATSPKQEAEILIERLQSGIKKITDTEKRKFVKHITNRLEGLDGNTVKVAKLVVDKSESGLEWRIDAAKDVCPVEDILEGNVDFETNWDKGIKFWQRFTSGVRKYNPRAYEILEVTDEVELVKANPADKRQKYKDMQQASFKFIQEAGGTTPTNYNFFYSLPQKFYGSFTEEKSRAGFNEIVNNLLCAWADPGQTWNTLGHLHVSSLDTANQSHVSIGNHDKPRYAHLSGLDADKFFDEGKGNAMGAALKESFNAAFKSTSVPESIQKDIEKAVDNLSNGKYHVQKDGKIIEKNIDSDYFGVRPFDQNIKDVLKEAKLTSKTTSDYMNSNKEAVDKLEKLTLVNMLKPAMKRYRAIMGLLVALPGNPTIYAGDELGETGFEYKMKNTFDQNRNHNHYDRLEKNNPSYIKEIESQKNEIAKLINLRKQKALSPLVDGVTIALDTKKSDVVGLYRYNENKDMIILLNNQGFNFARNEAGLKENQVVSVGCIDLSQETMLNYDAAKGLEYKQGLLSNLKTGATYKNALDQNDKDVYKIVEEKGKKLLKKFDKKGKETDIQMKESDLFLYREKDFNGNKNELSFSGNPHVAIANMKYEIPTTISSVLKNNVQNKTKAFV